LRTAYSIDSARASDEYAEDEGMTSVVSYPNRCSLWGDARYRGNCDGRLFKNLVLRYRAKSVADPMMGSGTTQDVVAGLNQYKKAGIRFSGGDLRQGFDLTRQALQVISTWCGFIRLLEHRSLRQRRE